MRHIQTYNFGIDNGVMVRLDDYRQLESENAALRERVAELEAELEQWRNGTRKHSETDTLLAGFDVDDYDDLFGGVA